VIASADFNVASSAFQRFRFGCLLVFFGRFLYDYVVVSCRRFQHCFECVSGFLVIDFVLGALSVFLGLCASSWLSLLGSLCEFMVVSSWLSVRVRGYLKCLVADFNVAWCVFGCLVDFTLGTLLVFLINIYVVADTVNSKLAIC
jgi:hypothetical protein